MLSLLAQHILRAYPFPLFGVADVTEGGEGQKLEHIGVMALRRSLQAELYGERTNFYKDGETTPESVFNATILASSSD